MSDDIKSKIADLEKELYSKDFKSHRVEDIVPHKEATPVPMWETVPEATTFLDEETKSLKHHSVMKKFVKFSVGFFVLAVVIAMFIWWRGSNIISGDLIDIKVVNPLAVAGGEVFETKFIVKNNNKVPMQKVRLFVAYPAGFYSELSATELQRASRELGTLAPGEEKTETVKATLYGEENTSKEIAVTIEYQIAGSNATLKKVVATSLRISSSPINIKVTTPKEASSGQEIEITVDINSNSKIPIGPIIVDAAYPPGFIFQSANPSPTSGANVWRLGQLNPQEKKLITIRGIVEGQEGEEKITKISIGTESMVGENSLGIIYNAATESSIITKPFLDLELAVNNNKTTNNVTSLNKGVRVDLSWQNNNPTKVSDGVIEVKLKGAALDKYSLYASGGGFYRSVDNTIVWDKNASQEFGVMDPGARGAVSFSFSPISLGIGAERLIKNPQIIFEVRARANQIGASAGTSGVVSTFLLRSVKFETDIRLSAKGLFFSGPFKNIGPVPPQADKETTYTISLTARNSANNVSDTYVKTTLPIYVKWLGVVYPEGEDITYNEAKSEVTWNVGRIPAGGSRDASFQISFLPSISHINRSPLLTGDFSITAMDDFTKTEVGDRKQALTTYISGDPQFSANDANVVQ